MTIITVKTGGIAADAVTDAKIADDVVGTEHLTANEVDTAALKADAVTAAQIADDAISEEHLDVTAITGHTAETTVADGDLVVVHDASASALRKMTVANLVANAGGGSLVKLAATTFGTAAAAVVFNSSLITSTYDNYKIFISGLATATDNNDIGILMSVDNGSNFATHVGSREATQITGDAVGGWAGNIGFIPLGSDEESDSTGSTNFEVTIYNVHDTSAYKFASGLGTVKNQNGEYYGYRIHGYIASNTAVNYVKVYASGGANLDKGTVTLYGIAK